jgi:hypothetical protein
LRDDRCLAVEDPNPHDAHDAQLGYGAHHPVWGAGYVQSLERNSGRCGRQEVEILPAEAPHNQKPKPFIWTKSARDILAKVMRARQALHRDGPVGSTA